MEEASAPGLLMDICHPIICSLEFVFFGIRSFLFEKDKVVSKKGPPADNIGWDSTPPTDNIEWDSI